MELKWLEDFLAVAESQNFSRAAVSRNTTQPALSRRVRALEAWYGVPLFDRSTYPVELTEAGDKFLPQARQTVADLYRSRREARAAVGVAAHTVTFAMPHALAVHFFPSWWRQQRRPADLKAAVVAADLDDCVDMLLTGASQYLLCYRHESTPIGLDAHGLQCVMIGSDRLLAVSAPGADGSPLFDFAASTDSAIPMLMYPKTSFLGRVTNEQLGRLQSSCNLSTRYESALVEAIKVEALMGEGIAWLPLRTIERELASGELVRLGDSVGEIPLEVWLYSPPTGGASDGLRQTFEFAAPPIDQRLA